jgi:PKD repeat protein
MLSLPKQKMKKIYVMKRALAITLLLALTCSVFATQDKKSIKIRITGPGGFPDETTIYFDRDITPVYSSSEDGPKAYNQIEHAPNLYSLSSDNVNCSTNGYSDLSQSETIALGVKTDTAGAYMISLLNLMNVDPTTIIQLEDRVNNVTTDLRTTFYPVLLNDGETVNGRFFLHVSRPINFIPVTSGCNNNDGQLQVDADNTVQWSYVYLYDSLGNFIDRRENISGPYSFGNLAEGNYTLYMRMDSYLVVKPLHLNGNYVAADIRPSSLTVGVNQEVTFESTTHNVSVFLWEMGDSTQIGGVANPTYSYVIPGTYEVVLNVSNAAGCSTRKTVYIEVGAATGIATTETDARKVWAYDKTITAVIDEPITTGAGIRIVNMLGQPVYQNSLTDLTTVITLNSVPPGYYIISLNNNKVETSKRVFIGE